MVQRRRVGEGQVSETVEPPSATLIRALAKIDEACEGGGVPLVVVVGYATESYDEETRFGEIAFGWTATPPNEGHAGYAGEKPDGSPASVGHDRIVRLIAAGVVQEMNAALSQDAGRPT